MYWTTSSALALSWMDELDPLNWNILDFVSRIKISSWLSDDRAKETCTQNKQKVSKGNNIHNNNIKSNNTTATDRMINVIDSSSGDK